MRRTLQVWTRKYMKKNDAFGTLYVVSSPSGGGKTTLISQLLECTPEITRAVTHTTRAKRPNEKEGVHYHFVSDEEFSALRDANGFLEWAEVFTASYGTSRKEVETKLKRGTDVILVIDWQGAEQVRSSNPESVSIFILPPSIEALRARLLARNEDSLAIVEGRMMDAINQINHYKDFDYLVINDDFDMALANLRSIVMARRLQFSAQIKRHASLINSLILS